MLGGLSVVLVGIAADSATILQLGAAALVGGSAAQVTMTRRAFNAYNLKQGELTAQVSLVPRWSPGDGVGTSLVVAF